MVELEHILENNNGFNLSPINIKYGIQTIRVLIALMNSNLENKTMNIK